MTSIRIVLAAATLVCFPPILAVAIEPMTDFHGDPLPRGAIARLGTIRFRAPESVSGLVYSPDGKRLVARSAATISLWDAETGRKLVDFAGGKVGPLAWRADGSGVMLVTEAGGKERIGDFTRERLKPPPSKDYYEQIQSRAAALQRDDEQFHAHAISPDGKHLVAGRRGNRERERLITVWEIDAGKPVEEFRLLHELGPQAGNCHEIVFSPDSKFVGVVSGPREFDDGRFPEQSRLLVLYELATGKERFRLAVPAPQSNGGHVSVALAAEARHVAIGGSDNVFRLYELGRRTPAWTFGEAQKTKYGGWSAVAIGDGQVFAANEEDKCLHVFELKTGRAQRAPLPLANWGTSALALTPDGKRLAIGGWGGAIRVLDAHSGRDVEPAPGHFGPVMGLQVFADGRRALTWGDGVDPRLWDMATGKELQRYTMPPFSGRLLVSPDDNSVLAIVDGKLLAFDAATGAARQASGDLAMTTGQTLHRSIDRQSVLISDEASVSVWDWPEGKLRRRIDLEADPRLKVNVSGPTREFQISPNGKLLVSRGLIDLSLWDLNVDSSPQMTVWQGNSIDREHALGFVGDGNRVAFSGRVMMMSDGDDMPGNFGFPGVGKGGKGGKKKGGGEDGGFGPGKIGPAGKKKGGFEMGAFGGQGGGFQGGNPFPGQGGFGQGGFPQGGGFGQNGFGGDEGPFQFQGGFGGGGKKKAGFAAVKSVALWDIRLGKLVRTFEPAGGQYVRDLASDPGGFVVAVAEDDPDSCGNVLLYEVATGQIRRRLPLQPRVVTALAFTNDGQRLITVGYDSAGLIWDVNLIAAARGRAPADDTEWDEAWKILALPPAAEAYEALLTFAANPDRSVELLRQRLRPTAVLNQGKLDQIVADLDDEKFLTREHAATELDKLGRVGVPAMRARAAKAQSREAKLRLTQYLERFDTAKVLPEELRAIRAVEFLEHAATPSARALIAEYAAGEPSSDLTIRAAAAKSRLERRKN